MKHLINKTLIISVVLGAIVGCGQESSEKATNESPAADNPQVAAGEAPVSPAPETAESAAAPVSYDYAKFAIIGITLDSTMQEAVAALEAHSTPMKITQRDGDVGSVYGARIRGIPSPEHFILASAQPHVDSKGRNVRDNHDKINVYGHLYPNNGKVAAVGRYVYFRERVLVSEMTELLTKTYGEPLINNGQMLSWSLQADGTPQMDPRVLAACAQGHTPNKLGPDMVAVVTAKTEQNPGIYGQCGFTFIVNLQTLQNPDFAQSMVLTLYDFGRIKQSHAQTIAFTEAEAEKLKAAERAAAAGADKPTL